MTPAAQKQNCSHREETNHHSLFLTVRHKHYFSILPTSQHGDDVEVRDDGHMLQASPVMYSWSDLTASLSLVDLTCQND